MVKRTFDSLNCNFCFHTFWAKKNPDSDRDFYIDFINNFYLDNNTTIPFLFPEIKRIAKIKTVVLHFLICYLANVENFGLGFTNDLKILENI